MQDYLSLAWDNLTKDVVSLDPGHLSLCTHFAGLVQAFTCDPGHLFTQSLSKWHVLNRFSVTPTWRYAIFISHVHM